ncbi:unnamed protein product [Sphenostylis stenocarpa]|uniref:Uncharacterized protein n=1 Tax=Sphenostylis stenocarpa TaxID=92480 RepID=A0AA86VYE0_9FABA|nr:unnamed protein product [Sphenostylis stenocarpa]
MKIKLKWIKREMKSLEPLTKDYDQLVEKGDKVESLARRFWDSEDLSGIHLQLSETEHEWLKSTRKLIEAKECVTNYYKHSRGLVRGCTTAIMRLLPIIDVIFQINSVKSKMIDHIQNKDENAKDIHKSMGRSRSQIRSLLDQYTIEEAHKSVASQNQKQKKPSTSIDELMKMGKELFFGTEERWSIYLLLSISTFINDLSQLQLETQTEKLWKTEVEELISETERCISNFSWWVS